MKLTFKIFIVIVSLFIPLLLIILAVFFHFLVFGEGASSDTMSQKYGYAYLAVYIFAAVLHAWLLIKVFKDNNVWVKAAVMASMGIAYIFTAYTF